MQNTFTTIKVGYSVGIYGCTEEYFTTIIVRDGQIFSVHHSGMYGSDDRVNNTIRDLGYKEVYTRSFFGKMTRQDYGKAFVNEYDAIAEVKHIIETGEYLK